MFGGVPPKKHFTGFLGKIIGRATCEQQTQKKKAVAVAVDCAFQRNDALLETKMENETANRIREPDIWKS